ncbi:ABC transporter permease [Serpentinicella alkaliphila]|uniref:ABC-2 type transport system permease protein n=1 Tax=Serpentinicella alkaliphila TaxID=1734049 RepID=A0A4R2TIB5_9FIRM|nr:ABC transporter permease [Serpentinicella alkaliphila]QUH25951.1 ABC transporter permease [Serpentinicella alkaliphila]TCQ02057.1 ABC-2 type transport system permease protein [Serpentinicella alkaliphila]
MQASKLFCKIIPRKFLTVFLIYTIIFVGLSILFSDRGLTQMEDVFELSKVKISVINDDNTQLSNGLESYIKSISRPVEIKRDEESIKDALFFRQTEFIVTIPKGFQNDFISADQPKVKTMYVPDSVSSQYAIRLIDNYLNTARLYILAHPEMSLEEVHEKVITDISTEVNVSFINRFNAHDTSLSNLKGYFNFLSYILIAMLISMVGRIMLIFNNKDIKMRNYCAPISIKSYNIQLILSNLSMALIIWLIFVVLAFVINKNTFNQTGALLFIVNSFVLTVLCLSISFLVATFATKNSIDPIGNCLSLGLSFLGGSFVPQALLSDTLRTLGTFNPIFWYIKVNDTIADLTSITQATLQPIIHGILVQLAFAIALFAIALVIIKQKRYAHK